MNVNKLLIYVISGIIVINEQIKRVIKRDFDRKMLENKTKKTTHTHTKLEKILVKSNNDNKIHLGY